MSNDSDYDICIIGSGPGGYVAAIRAAQLGLKTAIVEKDLPGGVCLNIGCIPSKALIHQAAVYRTAPDLEAIGVKVDLEGFDYSTVFAKSRAAADKLSKGVRFLLNKPLITWVEGEATDVKAGAVTLKDDTVVACKNIIIATGSRPTEIPGFNFDEKNILSSTGVLMLEKLPKSLLILGAGAIGVEFAHIMNAFGVEIHLVEMLDHLLPLEDDEIADVLLRSFKKRGIKTYTGTKALSQKQADGGLEVLLESKDGKQQTLLVEKILVSVGRTPNSGGMKLDSGIKIDDRGFIQFGDYYQTDVPGIYAIGDVVKTPLLAHVASKEGEIAVEHIAGVSAATRVDLMTVPAATYCEPQVASFGYSEKRALELGIDYKKAVFPYRGAGKSVVTEKVEGMVKILTAPDTGEILGAHIVGAEATELIHELLLARSSELLPLDITNMIHAHPTLSEAVVEAVRNVDGNAIHI